MTAEIYVSTDIEADGPIPGPHSMLSLGSAAFRPDGELVATWTANLETLEGASMHPDTERWWAGQAEAWAACRTDLQPVEPAMQAYADWVDALPGRAVFVAYPAGFDFTFVYWYLQRFVGRSPFSFSALDVKTFAMSVLGTRFHDTVKRRMPSAWFAGNERPHVALDDAIEQGHLFCRMLADWRERTEETR